MGGGGVWWGWGLVGGGGGGRICSFFSSILLFENRIRLSWDFDGFLKDSPIPGMGKVALESLASP